MQEGRTLYSDAGLTIIVDAEPDSESSPDDGDCCSLADVDAFRADRWSYVCLTARVEYDGATIGGAVLGGVAHGQLADVRADAFEFAAFSPLFEVMNAALMAAATWATNAEAARIASAVANAARWVRAAPVK